MITQQAVLQSSFSLTISSSILVYHWPAAHGPVCIPMRSLSVSWGRWRIVKRDTWSRRSRAILQISTMCRPSLVFGNPLTTTYASPIVSTWQQLRTSSFTFIYVPNNGREKRFFKTTFLNIARCGFITHILSVFIWFRHRDTNGSTSS